MGEVINVADLGSFTLDELQLTPEQRAVVGLREKIAEAMNSAYIEHTPEFAEAMDETSRHDGHQFYGGCYVCRGDVDELARRVQAVVTQELVEREQEITRLRAELHQLKTTASS